MSKKKTDPNRSKNVGHRINQKPNQASRKKSVRNKEAQMKFGDFSNLRGNLSIAGRDVVTHKTTITGSTGRDLEQLFDQLYTRIESRAETPPAVKEDLKAEVQDIQDSVAKAAKKNEKADESFLERRFRNIARMAPDILETLVATLGGPLAGLGVMARKIAEKAREEAKTN